MCFRKYINSIGIIYINLLLIIYALGIFLNSRIEQTRRPGSGQEGVVKTKKKRVTSKSLTLVTLLYDTI